MRVLGVDPGLTRCGLGVVEGEARALRMVAVGVVRTSSGRDTGERLAYVQDELDTWLDRFAPDAIALERVYAADHVPTVMTTAQVSGLVLLAGARRGIPVTLHTPTEVKAAVSGSGRADKAQITTMVTRILTLDEPPRPADAADALALAICHQWRGRGAMRQELAAASERARLRSVAGA
ncbi:crossover junction endodeoxyribonuclease RuvC [Janibacter anophelis]|uniref:crossover junction endodeoxyribonuclease RuvC n=1 Tax=Janibacter anophelis TaxID=319054 RepID=UPI000DEF2961|nr:crossover junction endodeoxyribonuclease RuvC [Janibacter anophelis]